MRLETLKRVTKSQTELQTAVRRQIWVRGFESTKRGLLVLDQNVVHQRKTIVRRHHLPLLPFLQVRCSERIYGSFPTQDVRDSNAVIHCSESRVGVGDR